MCCRIKVIVDVIYGGLPFAKLLQPHIAYACQLLSHCQGSELSILLLCSQPPCFNSCPCLSPGESSLRKRSPEGALPDQPPAKRVDGCALTGSGGRVEALAVSSPAPVVSGGAVAAERSPPICEGELCGVSFSSMRLRCNASVLSWVSSVE